MFKNYFKTAFRNLWKNKTYSFLNIFGLAIGITCAGFIFLWIENEKSYDTFNEKKKNVYRVMEHQPYEGKTYTFGSTPGPLGPTMQQELPGVQHTARTSWNSSMLFSLDEKAIFEKGFYADSSFFSIFTVNLIAGSRQNIFPQLNSLVISQKMAQKFFGNEKNVVGKKLKVDNNEEYVITGVFKDIPENTSLPFDWVSPFKLYWDKNDWLTSWGNNGIRTYVEMGQNTDVIAFNKKFASYIQSKDTGAVAKPFLFAMDDWRLRQNFEEGKQTGGRIQYVNMFSIVAWIILLIACINFMNLATARSEKRAREVGVRKVLGADKKLLIGQFIGESIFTAFISVLLAILLLFLLLPAFNALVEKQLSIGLDDPKHIALLVSIGLICGLVAGSYPAIYLSSFNPIYVFKGIKIKGSAPAFIRKGLVVLQFTISIILIIGTIIIYQQVQHIKTRKLGYSTDNLLQLSLQGDMKKNYAAIKQELISTGHIDNTSMGELNMLEMGSQTTSFTWEGKDNSKKMLITIDNISPEYISTAGIKIKQGRDFNPVAANDSNSVIINQTLAKMMRRENPVGTILYRDNQKFNIVGVTEDFLFGDMYAKSEPIVFHSYPENYNFLYVKLKKGTNVEHAVEKMQAAIKKYNPAYPVEYQFVDENFNFIFRSETMIGKLSRVFAVLAIIISCLGLLGLAAYTAERRTREIGIRKVLGASVTGVTSLLSKDFLKLVGISAIIAFPLAWWIMHNWLQDFAYRITISWWVFLVAGLLALLIALITVSSQAIRAALTNPVKSLRTE
jgi:predicted permease